jgi:MerR family transcriptional regulator, copper efflux regulator
LEESNINESRERVQIIEKLLTYKLSLESCGEDLEKELFNYYNDDNESVEGIEDVTNELKDLQYVSYENQYEAYLITQIKIVETLPPVIEEHIRMLNVGDDIDLVLESFELEVYHIKKNIYSNMNEWEALLDHITEERMTEITCNPKGYGDLILKELIWIRRFEDKLIH